MASRTKGLSVMNGTNLVFDTCAVVKLRMELLSKRNMSNNEEKDILEFLDALTVIPLKARTARTGSAIRQVSVTDTEARTMKF